MTRLYHSHGRNSLPSVQVALNPERFRLFILFPIPLLVDSKFKETVYENSTQYNFSLFSYSVEL